MGTLYLVATPIGNLEDMTERGLRVLREVPLIAAEDTRRTGKLLAHFGIETSMVSYHAHNQRQRRGPLLTALAAGDVALVSDAGTPGLSDPGVDLVRAAVAAGFPVSAVPGASSVSAAVGVSGLIDGPFLVLGFLPRRGPERRRLLAAGGASGFPLVLFEAPGRLVETLEEAAALWGDRPAVVLRELTKLHEEVLRGGLAELAERFRTRQVRGEIVVVIGAPPQATTFDDMAVDALLRECRRSGMSASQAAREVAAMTARPRSELYVRALRANPAESTGTTIGSGQETSGDGEARREGEGAGMWKTEQFSSVEDVVDFLNGRGLRPERIKLAVGRGDSGRQVFHLLYEEEDSSLVGVAVAEADVPEIAPGDVGGVMDEAEAIIADAQRDEPEGAG